MIRKRVRTFTQLIEECGRVHATLQTERLVYRGQTQEHFSDGKPLVSAKFYRSEGNLQEREEALERTVRLVARAHGADLIGKQRGVAAEALCAHYEHIATRMLDCTQILHVAASFALGQYGQPANGPAVVYLFDLRKATKTPTSGQFGADQVACSTIRQATRPMRQGAWVVWQKNPTGRVPFEDLLCAALTIEYEDRSTFWDVAPALPHEWLMAGDEVSAWFQTPGTALHPPAKTRRRRA